MNLFEKQNKPFAIKLSNRVREEIKKVFDWDICNPVFKYFLFIDKNNWNSTKDKPFLYTLITEAEFFGDGNNKLREKMQMYIDIYKEEHLVDALEQITDDFADKFAEWYLRRFIEMLNSNKTEPLTTAELRQIFKTNHYE